MGTVSFLLDKITSSALIRASFEPVNVGSKPNFVPVPSPCLSTISSLSAWLAWITGIAGIAGCRRSCFVPHIWRCDVRFDSRPWIAMGGPIDCFNCGGRRDVCVSLVRSFQTLNDSEMSETTYESHSTIAGDHFARDCPEGGKGKGKSKSKVHHCFMRLSCENVRHNLN